MPQITIRGIHKVIVQKASSELAKTLSELFECPEDHFTIDCLNTVSFFNGEEVPTYPFVLFSWFNRGQDKQDKAAKCVTDLFKAYGVPELEMAFVAFEKTSYYTAGEHY